MLPLQPALVNAAYWLLAHAFLKTGAKDGLAPPPDPLRWHPVAIPDAPADFVDGLRTVAVNGDPDAQTGVAAHLYLANRSMARRAFVDADGELLIVPQQGAITVRTELGVLHAKPGEVLLVPRGIVFKVELDGPSRGYVCENYGAPFRLPELGPIGSNGLANPRDFLAPVAAFEAATPSSAAFEDRAGDYEIVKKFRSATRRSTSSHGTATSRR